MLGPYRRLTLHLRMWRSLLQNGIISLNMNRMLLIVDPQVDFVTGSLPVPGAVEAMDGLADYVRRRGADYACRVITADRHPYDHFSFDRNGGPWPQHCVHDTVGAAVVPAVFDAVYGCCGEAMVLHKGMRSGVEEYSIFDSDSGRDALLDAVRRHDIGSVDLCGLAGDVCLLATLRDFVAAMPGLRYRVLRSYSPSLDGGAALDAFCRAQGIQ